MRRAPREGTTVARSLRVGERGIAVEANLPLLKE
jgi:hypothetical protein